MTCPMTESRDYVIDVMLKSRGMTGFRQISSEHDDHGEREKYSIYTHRICIFFL
jgi:hypothetical protein